MLSAVSSAGGFELTGAERDRLVALSRDGSSRRAVRARIVLALAEPGTVPARVAADLGVTVATVDKWCKRFEACGVDGLIDAERPGRPKADLVLSAGERDQLQRWSRRGEGGQAVGARGPVLLWRCAPPAADQQAGRGRFAGDGTHGRQMARRVRRQTAGRLDRRAQAGPSTLDPVGQGRRSGGGHPGGGAGQRHALVENIDGQTYRSITLDGGPDLATL